MSELVIIKDGRQCPECARKNTIRRDNRKCCGCGTRLFYPEDNFPAIAADCIQSFWVFFPPKGMRTFRGWVHSAHLGNPNPHAGPLDLTAPDSGYGRTTAQARAAKRVQEAGRSGGHPMGSN